LARTSRRIDADVVTNVAGADLVYTDVWLSMGSPRTGGGHRIDLLFRYQVNADVMAATDNTAAKLMQCLPAPHDMETDVGRQIHNLRCL
jgi:ornithine carbamoyltransferase